MLSAQFETTNEFSSLLRANTPVSRMMTTYTRRGPGQSYLKSVLADRINSLIEHKDLNLEINPLKVSHPTSVSGPADARSRFPPCSPDFFSTHSHIHPTILRASIALASSFRLCHKGLRANDSANRRRYRLSPPLVTPRCATRGRGRQCRCPGYHPTTADHAHGDCEYVFGDHY